MIISTGLATRRDPRFCAWLWYVFFFWGGREESGNKIYCFLYAFVIWMVFFPLMFSPIYKVLSCFSRHGLMLFMASFAALQGLFSLVFYGLSKKAFKKSVHSDSWENAGRYKNEVSVTSN